MNQIKQNTILANKLGLSLDELRETDWDFVTDDGRDESTHGYIIQFVNGPKEILDKIKGLDKYNEVWINPYFFEDYNLNIYDYEEQFETIISNKDYYDSFQKEISNLKRLNQLEIDKELKQILNRQLYVSAIGTLETFLSDTFINKTNDNEEYFKNFVETFPEFKDKNFPLRNIFTEYEKIKKTARTAMIEIIYHNLDKVRNMYKTTFKIDFPDIAELSKSVSIRHHLVHRNGKTKDGEEVDINSKMIDELIEKIFQFVETISKSLKLKG